MISASGSEIGSRTRIGWSSIRQNDVTGAPVRSEPKVGKAWACWSSSKAAIESISAAVTTPWPPRPWILTWNIRPPAWTWRSSPSSASDSAIPVLSTSRSGTVSRSALMQKKSLPS